MKSALCFALVVLGIIGCEEQQESRRSYIQPDPAFEVRVPPSIEVSVVVPAGAMLNSESGAHSGRLENCSGQVPANGQQVYVCSFVADSIVNTQPLRFYDSERCEREHWTISVVNSPNATVRERVPGEGCSRGWDLHLNR